MDLLSSNVFATGELRSRVIELETIVSKSKEDYLDIQKSLQVAENEMLKVCNIIAENEIMLNHISLSLLSYHAAHINILYYFRQN